MARSRRQGGGSPQVAGYNSGAKVEVPEGFRYSPSKLGAMSMAAIPYIGRGRPVEGSSVGQATMREMERSRDDVLDWRELPEEIGRRVIPNSSFANYAFSTSDYNAAMRAAPRISAIIQHSTRLVKRLCNTELTITIKNKDADGNWTVDDKEAMLVAMEALDAAGHRVVCDIPGAFGSQVTFWDGMFEGAYIYGGMGAELVLSPNRKRGVGVQFLDASTVEIRRNLKVPNTYHIGQRNMSYPDGWCKLNPLLCTFLPLNGSFISSITGESDAVTALHLIPSWQGFFGKLSIYLQRAAFGFLDGKVNTETLKEMWINVPSEVKASFKNDFMVWANAMTAYLSHTYKTMGEADPDAMIAHLDILEISGESSGTRLFPVTEGATVMKGEFYNSTGTPGELLGEGASPGDQFAAMKIEVYRTLLSYYQLAAAHVAKRLAHAAVWVRGWPREIKVEAKWKPVAIDNPLAYQQMVQLAMSNARFKRDEGLITQRQFAHEVTGKDPIAQNPLAESDDIDGPSGPSKEILFARYKADGNTPNPQDPGKPADQKNKENKNG
jgi:hypothetical protein